MFLNNKYIYGFLTAVVLGLTACSDFAEFDNGGIGSGSGADNEVSFLISLPTGQSTQTRGSSPVLPNTISDGSKIDKLIFSIYEVPYKEDGTEDVDNAEIVPLTSGEDKYQQTLKVDKGSWPISIKLSLVPSKGYRVVFWAQNSKCDAYDTEDLTKITVNYDEHTVDGKTVHYKNNDERRDAFSGVAVLKPGDRESSQTVILHRPFAQINIGTSGWDYEGLALIEPNPAIIKYSKIVIKGVAKSFSPLKQKVETEDEETEITFDWGMIPAYSNLEETDLESVTGVYTTDHKTKDDQNTDLSDLGIFTRKGVEEEFLFIDLPNPNNEDETGEDVNIPGANSNFQEHHGYDHEFADYIGWKKYDELCAQYSKEELIPHIFTETFKYLSMCYVLVPSKTDEDGKVTGSTVDVKFDFSDGIKQSSEAESGEAAGTQSEYNSISGNTDGFEINNVPVKSNYRTNIVATDGTGFFMNTNNLKVSIYTESLADYYKHYQSNDTEWDEDEKEHGGTENDDYIPPTDKDKEDYDPDLFKRPLLRRFTLDYSKDSYLPSTDNVIRAFVYLDANNDFKYLDENDPIDRLNKNITIKVSDKLYTTVSTEYKGKHEHNFYIGSKQLDAKKFKNDEKDEYYNININKSFIEDYVAKKYVAADSKMTLDEDYNMYYYPIQITVKTTLQETEGVESQYYRVPEDQSIDIRLYPLYKSYTFSSTSKDDGYGIWNEIHTNGRYLKFANYLENSSAYSAYAIDNATEVSSNEITVKSRSGTSKNPGEGDNNSVAIFSAREGDSGDQSDHLIIMGACNSWSTSNNVETPENHYIKFNIDKKCKITVKWGRDKDADNGSKKNDITYTRNLNINWGQKNSDIIADTWKPYPLSDIENTYISSSEAQRYSRTESRIAPTVTTDVISKDTPVYIYEKTSGTSYYWILVSPAE